MKHGYIIHLDNNNAVLLTRAEWDNQIMFGGVPAIRSYADEHPEVPRSVIDELLARDAGFTCVQEGDAWVVRDKAATQVMVAANEDDAWRDAATESVRLYESREWGKRPLSEVLPEFCLVVIPELGPGNYVCAIRRGERGYSPTTYDVDDVEKAKTLVEHVNKRLGVTDLQAECMTIGSMCGWGVPGAHPGYMAQMVRRMATRHTPTLPAANIVMTEASWRPADAEQAHDRVRGRRTSALDALSIEQRMALVAFRKGHGRDWKSALLEGWHRGSYRGSQNPSALQQLRNQHGPEWLQKLTQFDFDAAQGNQPWYGVLRDCSDESLSFLESIDGVVVGHRDRDNVSLRHVKVTGDAAERVREFPADFVFESLIADAARAPVLELSEMSDDALEAEGAYLSWRLHSDISPLDESQVESRRDEVTAEAKRRYQATLRAIPSQRLAFEDAPVP